MHKDVKKLFDSFEILQDGASLKLALQHISQSDVSIILITKQNICLNISSMLLKENFFTFKLKAPVPLINLEEPIYITFSVPGALYAVKSFVQYSAPGEFLLPADIELRKIRLRKDPRVNTTNLKGINLNIEDVHSKTENVNLLITNLSTGGLSFLLSDAENIQLALGQEISCDIIHRFRSIKKIKAIIRHQNQIPTGIQWGIEFQLTNAQKILILELSLQIQRESLMAA